MALLEKPASQGSADKTRCARNNQPHGFFAPPSLTQF
jgi:hypothetical protein